LRTSIAYSSMGRSQIIAITSALPKDGKSTTAVCLARVTALDDPAQRVLVIDCDLQRRSLNRFAGDRAGPGLMEVLSGQSTLEEALQEDVPSGAWILPLRNSAVSRNLLTGDAMVALLEQLRRDFTWIIIDAPPILPVAETRILSTYADAVVFAVRWRKVADHAIRAALKLLPEGHARLAGILLTQVDMKKQGVFGKGDPGSYYKDYKDYYA
jgi:succinoglycan biosynthesis transport protein ExoP